MVILLFAAAIGFLVGGFSGAAWAVVIVAAIGFIGGLFDLMNG